MLLALALPVAAAFGWSRPERATQPVLSDLLPAHVGAGPGGRLALGYGATDADDTRSSQALLTWRSHGGSFGQPQAVPGAQSVLAVAWRGGDLMELVGASPSGFSCCSSVIAVGPARGGSPGVQRSLLEGLAGATDARLLLQGQGLLAVVATERGVWAARTRGRSLDFSAPQLLSTAAQLPQELAATVEPNGRSYVAWAARQQAATGPGPGVVYLAGGRAAATPGRGRPVLRVPSGHAVDELALVAGPRLPLLVWIESWFDRRGQRHSVVRGGDLSRRLHPQTLSDGRELAAGLAAAGGGAELVAWKGCNRAGGCGARALRREPSGHWGALVHLGATDPGEDPAAALTGDGRSVIGFISRGHVLAATGRAAWTSPAVVSPTNYAGDLSVVAAGRGAAAVWTQGTLQQSLVLAELR